MYSTLIAEPNEGLLIITVNRPEKLNALNATVLEELKHAFNVLRNDPSLKGAIITGAGEKAFVAGADIGGFLKVDKNSGEQLAKAGQEIFSFIETTQKPVVAAVNGYALGGGCELAMSCHFRYASENAMFGQPEINLGIIPGYGGTQRLTKLIGKGRAMELMMKGEMINAQEALRIGLINKLFPQDKLLEETKSTMRIILSKSQSAMQALIAAINAEMKEGANGFDEEAKCFGKAFSSDDMTEGVSAFIEKRKPNFK